MAYFTFTVTEAPVTLSYTGRQNLAPIERQEPSLAWVSTGKYLGGPKDNVVITAPGDYRVLITALGCETDPPAVITATEDFINNRQLFVDWVCADIYGDGSVYESVRQITVRNKTEGGLTDDIVYESVDGTPLPDAVIELDNCKCLAACQPCPEFGEIYQKYEIPYKEGYTPLVITNAEDGTTDYSMSVSGATLPVWRREDGTETVGTAFSYAFVGSVPRDVYLYVPDGEGVRLTVSDQDVVGLDFLAEPSLLELDAELNDSLVVTDAHLSYLADLQLLHLPDTSSTVTSAGIRGLIDLTEVWLTNTFSVITDFGLEYLSKLESLHLTSTDSTITDTGLAYIPLIEELYLDNTASVITDIGLASTPNLIILSLANDTASDVTDAGLALVPSLTFLQLRLTGSTVTDTGLASVPGLTYLSLLGTAASNVTDTGLASVSGLTYLNLNSTISTVTNTGLGSVPALTTLFLSSTNSTISSLTANPLLDLIGTVNLALSSAQVDGLLTTLDAHATSNGVFSVEGTNQPPTATGCTAITNLQGRGWTVTYTAGGPC